MKTLIAATGLVLLAGLGATAFAEDRAGGVATVRLADNQDRDGGRDSANRSDWMTVAQITDKYTAAGYQVRNIKTEDNGYELYAIDRDGNRIEVYLDPRTGEITGDAD